jgi:glycosyltransferase involved in cell wall biosynthesis
MNVSVVIPLYNKARHIRRAIDSVLTQSYGAFELIVVDDGSTDGSGQVASQIADPRLRLIVQKNAGECAARNRGIQEATGDLIAFLDADDEWLPGFLSTVMALRNKHPEAGLYATGYRFSRDGITWRPSFATEITAPQGGLLNDYFQAAMFSVPVTASSVMIPKNIFNDVGLFPLGVKRGGDLFMWANIALRYRVAWSPVDGAIYHLSADNRACDHGFLTADIAAGTIVDNFLRSGALSVSSRYYIQEFLVRKRLSHACLCYFHGKQGWMRMLLNQTSATRMFRTKRLFLLALMFVPLRLTRSVLRANAILHHR